MERALRETQDILREKDLALQNMEDHMKKHDLHPDKTSITQIHVAEDNEENLECGICLCNTIDVHKRNTFMPCGHSNYCGSCITELIGHGQTDIITCPTCKTDVAKVITTYL
jgi:hypothetical protein